MHLSTLATVVASLASAAVTSASPDLLPFRNDALLDKRALSPEAKRCHKSCGRLSSRRRLVMELIRVRVHHHGGRQGGLLQGSRLEGAAGGLQRVCFDSGQHRQGLPQRSRSRAHALPSRASGHLGRWCEAVQRCSFFVCRCSANVGRCSAYVGRRRPALAFHPGELPRRSSALVFRSRELRRRRRPNLDWLRQPCFVFDRHCCLSHLYLHHRWQPGQRKHRK